MYSNGESTQLCRPSKTGPERGRASKVPVARQGPRCHRGQVIKTVPRSSYEAYRSPKPLSTSLSDLPGWFRQDRARSLREPAPHHQTFPVRDSRSKQEHAFASHHSRDRRFLDKHEKRLCRHPGDHQKGTSRDGKHHERAEMMIARLSTQGSSLSHSVKAIQARENQSTKSLSQTERRRNSSCRFRWPPLRNVTLLTKIRNEPDIQATRAMVAVILTFNIPGSPPQNPPEERWTRRRLLLQLEQVAAFT